MGIEEMGLEWDIVEADDGSQLHIYQPSRDEVVISEWKADTQNLILSLEKVLARLKGE